MNPLTPAFVNFLQELSANNNRDWFNHEKKRFKADVEAPFHAFVAEMIARMDAIRSGLDLITPKDCIFRIYRDTRFSKDKTPYKTHMAALIGPGGRKEMAKPSMYIQLSGEDARLYSGVYKPDKSQLYAIRQAIVRNPLGFQKAYSDKDFQAAFGKIQGDKNKRLPAEFREAAEQEPLLFNKGFYYYHIWSTEQMLKQDFHDELMRTFAAADKVNDFLIDALAEK